MCLDAKIYKVPKYYATLTGVWVNKAEMLVSFYNSCCLASTIVNKCVTKSHTNYIKLAINRSVDCNHPFVSTDLISQYVRLIFHPSCMESFNLLCKLICVVA